MRPAIRSDSKKRKSAVAHAGGQHQRAGHEGAAAASYFFTTIIKQDSFGNIKALGAADDMAVGEEFSLADGAQKIQLEGGGENEGVSDEGLHGEKGGVIESFEINGAMNGAASMIKILADGEFKFGAAFFGDAKDGAKPFVDGRAVVHPHEIFKMRRHIGGPRHAGSESMILPGVLARGKAVVGLVFERN